jgi:hypothetical protein
LPDADIHTARNGLNILQKIKENTMIITDWIHAIAGSFILISLVLGIDSPNNPLFVSRYWLLFTAFVGVNLLQYGFTKFCPMALILKKLGVPEQR